MKDWVGENNTSNVVHQMAYFIDDLNYIITEVFCKLTNHLQISLFPTEVLALQHNRGGIAIQSMRNQGYRKRRHRPIRSPSHRGTLLNDQTSTWLLRSTALKFSGKQKTRPYSRVFCLSSGQTRENNQRRNHHAQPTVCVAQYSRKAVTKSCQSSVSAIKLLV